MLRRCIIAKKKERFEGHTSTQHPQHYIRLLKGLSSINLTRWNGAQCLVWGVRGAFTPSAAMVVTVFCSLPEQAPLFLVELQQRVGIARKLLTRRANFSHLIMTNLQDLTS
jgi:hypothetical protein